MGLKKRYIALLLAGVVAASAAGCSGGTSQTQTSAETQAPSEAAASDSQASTEAPADSQAAGDSSENAASDSTASGSNILIVYFTAAENSGVDAEASASYSDVNGEPKGRMQALAEMIQDETGGDIFSIHTTQTYPADPGELIDYADQEQAEDARPELANHIENLDSYDTVFIGFPNWWADMPQPLYTFFDEYDFSGKTIIPFNSHNGSRFSNTIATIGELEPDATVIENGFTINEREVPDAADDIAAWLDEIGY